MDVYDSLQIFVGVHRFALLFTHFRGFEWLSQVLGQGCWVLGSLWHLWRLVAAEYIIIIRRLVVSQLPDPESTARSWLPCCLAAWLPGCLAGCLAALLAGWLAGCLLRDLSVV